MKEDPNPLATLHPRARKVCRFFKSGVRTCRRCLFFSIIGSLACVLGLIPLWRSPLANATEIAGAGCFWLACVCAALCVVFYVLRLVVIVMFFMRYSLGQLMGSIMIYGTCMTLIIQLPPPWNFIPGAALVVLLLTIWVYIVAHDPEDPWFSPAFVRMVYGPKPVKPEDAEQANPAEAEVKEGAAKGPEDVR